MTKNKNKTVNPAVGKNDWYHSGNFLFFGEASKVVER